MIKRMLILLVLAGGVFGGLNAFVKFRAGIIKTIIGGLANPPQTVSTTVAQMSDWQPKLTVIGTFQAVSGADLSLEVPGIVQKINFESGREVEKGQVLLELRNDDDTAKLESLKAAADLDAVTLHRDEGQLKINAVSQATVDSDRANVRTAAANVAQQQAILDEKTLRAPFTGRLGIRQVDYGQFISAGTKVVSLQTLDPIYLDFMLPQQAAGQIKVGGEIEARVEGFAEPIKGEIQAMDSKLDSTSRNLQIRARLANPDRKMLPGMFATVEAPINSPERLVTLPQTAIVYNTYGDVVYVIDDADGKDGPFNARQSAVTVGPARGDQVAIRAGVKAGETVITAGQIKLHNGSIVKINNSIQPLADANPLPKDR
jgi:membrane fusion protein (multidrug efflux system)